LCWEAVWWNTPRIWRDFGSVLPFQTDLTQTKPVLPLPKTHGLQVKDQGGRQCCHTKYKKFSYWPALHVSLLAGHASCIYIYSVSGSLHSYNNMVLVKILVEW
jgi:hypothetical protein